MKVVRRIKAEKEKVAGKDPEVSDTILSRTVAVKRLLQEFTTLATRDVSILPQSDDHTQRHHQESHPNLFYIALVLCPASLADIIENPHEWKEIAIGFDAKRAMRQVANGLRHLHGLGLIHRDIKPQNILISSSSSSFSGGRGETYIRLWFMQETRRGPNYFLPTVKDDSGTVGWRAPEILRGNVKLDELSTGDDSTPIRLTKRKSSTSPLRIRSIP